MHAKIQFDENGNHVETTIFESYLAKFITENTFFYEDVFRKIMLSIKKYIDSHNDRSFDRLLFSLFSNFNTLFPGYNHIDKFFQKNLHVQEHVEFHKQFFESGLLKNERINSKSHITKNKIYSLVELIQFTINKNPWLQTKLKKQLRPKYLFSDEGRSRIELPEENFFQTRKLGITTLSFVPYDLENYFPLLYEPAQFQFKRNKAGFFSKWLKKRELPFISGPSGTIEVIFNGIVKLDTYSSIELKKYFMASAAAMVTRGHHSFTEVLIMAKRLGFVVEDLSDRKKYYEQFLTRELIESDEYQYFLEDPWIKDYFNEFSDLSSSIK